MIKSGSLFYKPKKRDKEISKKRWNFGSIILRAIGKACTVVGAFVLFSALLSTILIASSGGKSAKPLPDDMVLVFKIEDGISEIQTRPTLFEPFPFYQPTLRNVVDTIDKAKEDNRVRGIVFSLKGGGVSLAHIQEVRDVIKRFKESGKFTKIYSSSYAEVSNGLGQYYLASVFDEIWMQPVGLMSVSGLNMEMPFAREALKKVGVNPQFLKREKYKSAMETFTGGGMSASNKEMMESIVNNLSSQMVVDIAADRKTNVTALSSHIDKGLLTGKEALKANLIDRLDYADTMVSEMRKEATGDPDDESLELITLGRYSQEKWKDKPGAKKSKKDIALVYAVGAIVDMAGADGTAGADEISSAIADAYKDDDIEAIVLRVDSPGGSPSASETIRRAIVKAKEKGKKVIISMGPVAASGGYWISVDADKIFASSGTLTGSIGVVMGKFEASELWKKIGINWEGPRLGANADIWSLNKPFDAEAKLRMNVLIDDVYDNFLTRVAEGRGMDKKAVRKIAQGRAWTGEQAKKVGLVDEIGGLDDALDYTAQLVAGKGKNRRDLNIIRMPRDLGRFERLMELFGSEVGLGMFVGKFLGVDSAVGKKLKALLVQANLVSEHPTTVYDPALEAFR